MSRPLLPLASFPPEERERIQALVDQPTPPPKILRIELDVGLAVEMPSRARYEWYVQRGLDPDKLREPIPQWMRAYVIKRDGMVCGICHEAVEEGDVHIDHILPVARGGRSTVDNLQVAHSACNLRKGARG